MGIQLPRWVWVGALALSAVAGMVNVVGFLGFEHQGLGHLTGATSQLGIALTQARWASVTDLGGLLLAFFAGASLSGLIIQDSQLRLGRRYGVMLMIECALLLAATAQFARHDISGAWLAAMACGVQNALATTFSGAIVRTTHLTGMFTDLGIGLGHLLRGLPLALRRMGLSALIISGFLAGSVAGALLYACYGYAALYVPAAITGVAGAGYTLLASLMRHRLARMQQRQQPPR